MAWPFVALVVVQGLTYPPAWDAHVNVTEMVHPSENNCSHFRPEEITYVLTSVLASVALGLVPVLALEHAQSLLRLVSKVRPTYVL